jgi:hypothetical protein
MDAASALDESMLRGRRSRVVLIPRRRNQIGGCDPQMMVTKKPDHQGERGGNR